MTRPIRTVRGLIDALPLEGVALENNGVQVAFVSMPGLEPHRSRLEAARRRGQCVRITITIERKRS